MNFEKFEWRKKQTKNNQTPANMMVGQVVFRHNPKPGSLSGLRSLMKKAMIEKDYEFSHGWDGENYAIRRDK